jgi:hypothetical protein
MTQQQLIEKILRKFPDRKEGEIRDELNEVQKEFCRETRILEGEFTTFDLDGSSMYYTMDSTVVTVKQVDLNGSKIDPLGGVYEIESQT